MGWELLSHKYLGPDPLCKRQQNSSVEGERKEEFSSFRDEEITSAMVRERAGAASPSAPGGRGCPQWHLLPVPPELPVVCHVPRGPEQRENLPRGTQVNAPWQLAEATKNTEGRKE